MKKLLFTGSGVAIVTPFNEEGVDYSKLKELIEFQIANGSDAVIICGTTGESSTMTDKEQKDTIKFAVDIVAKRVPVIAGAGSNNTAHSVELSKYAQQVGADGLLLVTPYYNKTTQKGLIEHYTYIATHVDLPIILYNVPGRTGLNINPDTCYKLSKVPNIVAVKEASGNISQIAEIAALCGDDLYIYSGNDDQVVPLLALGAKGVISVMANIIPKDTHNMVQKFLTGDLEGSRTLQLSTINLIKALFIEVNPIPIKEAMNILGYNVGQCRLPLTTMGDKNIEYLKQELTNYGLNF